MSDVKSPTARPTLREEQAAVTRRRILDAGRHLFFRDGYAATTLKAVALEAGVAVQTVYAVFGSKAAILAELRSLVVTLPEADSAFRASMELPTIEGRLTSFAHSIRRRWELAGDIVKVNEDAARADPAVRAGVAEARERRRQGIASLAQALARDLAPEMDVARATALLDALTLHDVYAQLVDAHRWPADAYEAWLAEQLIANLAPAGASPESGG
jgi:AcrR family transcriptional regulator